MLKLQAMPLIVARPSPRPQAGPPLGKTGAPIAWKPKKALTVGRRRKRHPPG